MKLLLDQGLPRGAAVLLRAAQHDAIRVGDIGMAAATDMAIRHPDSLAGPESTSVLRPAG